MNISKIDFNAIGQNDSDYFLNKGAELYNANKYNEAIEYYQISAAMKNHSAISNLGYCYLYGRGVDKDETKAVLYFTIAARQNDVDALYKLGTLYLSGKIVEKDSNVALYFLEKARNEAIIQDGDLDRYPSLCYTLANEYMKNLEEHDCTEIFDLLNTAKYGYEFEIEENEATYYQKYYEEVIKLIEDPMFDDIRDEYDF